MSQRPPFASPSARSFGETVNRDPVSAVAAVIASIAADAGAGAAIAGTIGSIGADALVGAGLGAAGAAITGGKPLIGALTGGLTGGAIGGFGAPLAGALGVSPAAGDAIVGGLTDAAATAATNPKAGLQGALMGGLEGGLGGYAAGSLGGGSAGGAQSGTAGAAGAGGTSAPNWATPDPTLAGNLGSVPGGADPLVSSSAAAASPNNIGALLAANGGGGGSASGAGGGGGAAGGLFGGKISNTSLALGALSALGSILGKPQQYPGALQTPSQTALAQANMGPYWNASLNTNVPGRTAVPFAPAPASSWYTYGSRPEPLFFQGNSLQNFGFAHGGSAGEFTTGGRSKHVEGPGTGVSDSVPARLSNGEYVLTASDVSRLGNPENPSAPGANERGARILDHDRGALARLVGQRRYTPNRAKKDMNETAIRHYR